MEIQKSNVVLVGPTGSGKTLLAKSMARIAGVPVAIVDATSLTQVRPLLPRLCFRCRNPDPGVARDGHLGILADGGRLPWREQIFFA